jgi:nicotinic acid mononucleotide adenylyltransferase
VEDENWKEKEMSSTIIRKHLRERKSIEAFTKPCVAQYVLQHCKGTVWE